jgi:hypothetical protein
MFLISHCFFTLESNFQKGYFNTLPLSPPILFNVLKTVKNRYKEYVLQKQTYRAAIMLKIYKKILQNTLSVLKIVSMVTNNINSSLLQTISGLSLFLRLAALN